MLKYEGNHLSKTIEIRGKELLMPYLPAPELVRAVNRAILLKRPLLLKGEPGSGKTLLAKDVAHELGVYPQRYFEWRVKSTSKAQDGIYTIDYLRRLYDVQTQAMKGVPASDIPLIDYINEGPLFEAFNAARKNPDQPVVLLIDEIDKADIDFPNDLLHELEQKSFTIRELEKDRYEEDVREIKVPKDNQLIIFITSNNEKELPAAFLRRCLFYYIDFPDNEQLSKIVQSHYPKLQEDLIQHVVAVFQTTKEAYEAKIPNDKSPSTSELLDWCNLLSQYIEQKDEQELTKLKDDISVIIKSENAIKVILKNSKI